MSENFFDKIKNRKSPYVIAEIGSNHNGDMELAKKLIQAAKDSGADCVKFQSWTKDTIFAKVKYEENHFLADDYRDRDDYTLEEIVEEFSISEQQLYDMKVFADSIGIDCTSTPFSKKEADYLVDKMETPFFKIASMDLNNYQFLEFIAKKGLPIIISTGLSELHEIDKAIRVIEKAGNTQICILHCVAIYPPKDEQVNLKNITTLQTTYADYPIGFSDHTLGTEIPLASAALGAKIIEKHFTLDKEMFGWDHKVSADPKDMEVITTGAKRIATALGTGRVFCVEPEERKKEFRRSIVTTGSFPEGHVLTEADIDYKRPGTGIKPEEKDYVVGRKLAKAVGEDELLTWEDFA